MKRKFDYEAITISDIENNLHFAFICDGDNKEVIVEGDEK